MSTSEGLIAVLPTREWRGLADLSNAPDPETGRIARPVTLVPFAEAFERRWETDAHFVCYFVEPYDPTEPFFRLHKTALHDVRKHGGDVVLRYIALEWDTGEGPQHVPWNAASLRRFQDSVADAEARDPSFAALVRSAAVTYYTAKGYRWVWKLDRALPADEGETKIAGLIDRFWAAGVEADRRCADWTRLFRLPRVLRVRDA